MIRAQDHSFRFLNNFIEFHKIKKLIPSNAIVEEDSFKDLYKKLQGIIRGVIESKDILAEELLKVNNTFDKLIRRFKELSNKL
jgi:hypothetical protein